MAFLHVTDRNGKRHLVEGADGWRVMEILRDTGLGVDGVCGGACDCATCHVVIAPEWADRLQPPGADERFKLDELPEIEPTSRLSCQILWAENLDGLTLTLAEAS